jgi:hypothetical protein
MAKRNGGIIGPANTPTSSVAAGVWRLRDAFNSIKNGTWPLVRSVATNSLRFNAASSDYLNRTPASAGNRQKFTISLWVKINGNTSRQVLFWTPQSSSTFAFFDSGELRFGAGDGASWYYVPTQLFRDVSAWYHLVFAVDTTQATASDRVKLYVNGSQITSFSSTTNPTQNFSSAWNNNAIHYMGAGYDGGLTYYYGGYMSEIHSIDGQQLTPSSFGASNSSGVWYPIAYQGTYGTNGFYLKFANSASLGTDSSGNNNTFTVNNLTSVDQSTDTELNNFATWNSLPQWGSGIVTPTLSEGNLQQSVGGASSWATQINTIGVDTGKWYAEFKCSAVGGANYATLGVTSFTGGGSGSAQSTFSGVWYNSNGEKWVDGSNLGAYGATYTTGDIIGIALDKTANTVIFYKNGTSQGSISLPSSITSSTVFIGTSIIFSTTIQANFGSPMYSANGYTDGAGYGNFSYAVPSGYYALCTKNLNTYG